MQNCFLFFISPKVTKNIGLFRQKASNRSFFFLLAALMGGLLHMTIKFMVGNVYGGFLNWYWFKPSTFKKVF